MDRRDFLRHSTLTAAVLAASPAYSEDKTRRSDNSRLTGLSILQGYTNENTTQLAVCVGKSEQVSYSLTDVESDSKIEPTIVKSVKFGSSDTRVDKVKFSGLSLGHKYHLQIFNKKNKLLDDRYLTTVDLNKSGARVALMSCMNDLSGVNSGVWKAAAEANLDYIFFIGDAVYGDFLFFHGPSYLWSRYIESRDKIPFYRWKNLKPVIATWDDHDYGKNNEDGGYKHKETALQHFETFFAQEPDDTSLIKGQANSVFLQAFKHNFALYDSRYFRGYANPDSSQAFFGHEQIHFMSNIVRNNPLPTWVLNGSPIYGRSEKNASYQVNAPEELEYFLREIKSWNCPVIFGAGDLHYSEVSKISKEVLGYETFELVSSCMHSTKKKTFFDNPNPQLNGYLHENFLMLEQIGLATDPVWNVSCVNDEAKIVFCNSIQFG